jgi:ATP-dependent Lon protease
LSFVGNIDVSVQQVVNSNEHDLFQPLPPELDLAVMDRFAATSRAGKCPRTAASS